MRRILDLLALTAAALAFGPSLAAADVSAPSAPAAPPPTAPVPITIRAVLQNQGGLPVDAVIAAGRLRVVGTVRPFVAGQSIFVRTVRRGLKLETRSAPVVSIGHGLGRFSALIGVGGQPASVSVRISHPASALQGGLDTGRRIAVVRASVSPGQTGAAVRLLQQELAGLHYAVSRSGRYDQSTQSAVVALRKLTNLVRTSQANRIVFEKLGAGAGAFKVRYPGQGAHFEGDLTHQVLAEVLPGGVVRNIYEMSSGKPSTPTVIGNFNVYLKTFGTNSEGMVDANYFIRGYAIHGYADVPTYPASHGCLRIPIPDAAAVYAWARIGQAVDVYYRNGGGSHQVRGNAGP